jgi:hypothetical protein
MGFLARGSSRVEPSLRTMTVGVWPLKAIFEESSWVEGTVYEGGSFVVELSSCGGAGQQSVLFWGYLSGWLPESSLVAGRILEGCG